MVDFFTSVLFTFGFNASDDTSANYVFSWASASHFLIVLIFRRDLLRIAPLAGFMTAFFYLFLQYSKTAYHYDVGLSLASIFAIYYLA